MLTFVHLQFQINRGANINTKPAALEVCIRSRFADLGHGFQSPVCISARLRIREIQSRLDPIKSKLRARFDAQEVVFEANKLSGVCQLKTAFDAIEPLHDMLVKSDQVTLKTVDLLSQ